MPRASISQSTNATTHSKQKPHARATSLYVFNPRTFFCHCQTRHLWLHKTAREGDEGRKKEEDDACNAAGCVVLASCASVMVEMIDVSDEAFLRIEALVLSDHHHPQSQTNAHPLSESHSAALFSPRSSPEIRCWRCFFFFACSTARQMPAVLDVLWVPTHWHWPTQPTQHGAGQIKACDVHSERSLSSYCCCWLSAINHTKPYGPWPSKDKRPFAPLHQP